MKRASLAIWLHFSLLSVTFICCFLPDLLRLFFFPEVLFKNFHWKHCIHPQTSNNFKFLFFFSVKNSRAKNENFIPQPIWLKARITWLYSHTAKKTFISIGFIFFCWKTPFHLIPLPGYTINLTSWKDSFKNLVLHGFL